PAFGGATAPTIAPNDILQFAFWASVDETTAAVTITGPAGFDPTAVEVFADRGDKPMAKACTANENDGPPDLVHTSGAGATRPATTGTIEGRVTDQATGKALSGVTVTVTSPALQGEQTEFTEADGHYTITELPPGEYMVRLYFANISVERPGVIVSGDKTL